MQSRKKLLMFLLSAVVVSALAIAPAHAQSGRASFDVPFDFIAGKSVMKAGTYRFTTDGNFVVFVSSGGKMSQMLLLPGSAAPRSGRETYLEFKRYGNESFLSKVVFSNDTQFDLPRSSREKEILAQIGSGEVKEVLSGAAQ
jgi:hypothetical protein